MAEMRALVCEDDELARRTIEAVLNERGVEVIAVVDVLAHLANLVRYGHPDIVVLDLGLADNFTPREALGALAAIAEQVPVVVFSAHDALRDEALAHGARAFVDKPHFDRLGDAVSAVVVAERAGG